MNLEKIKSELFDVEELAEMLSDLIIEKLGRKFEFNKIEKEHFIHDVEVEPLTECDFENLFRWSNLEEKCELEIIDTVIFNFFERSLGKSNKKLIKKILKSFESDVIVSLMDNSLSNLIYQAKNNERIHNFLYCEYDQFLKEISYYTKKLNVDENEAILIKIEEYKDFVSSSIPLQLVPFGAYALVNSKILSENLIINTLNSVEQIKLKWLTKTAPNIKEGNKDTDRILTGQVAFEDFVQLLNLGIISEVSNGKSEKYNPSLNFYYFNKYTSLYDVNLLSSELFKNSRLIRLQRQYPDKLYEKLSYTEKYFLKQNLCEDFANLIMIKGVLFKKIILKNHLNTSKFKSIGFAKFINSLMEICMYDLEEAIYSMYKKDSNFAIVPEEIRIDLIVFKFLSERHSPYNKLIRKTAGKYRATDFPITSKKEMIKYELYHYAYKAIFEEKKQMSEI